MMHYKVEYKSGGDLATAYPHDPADGTQSMQDYLEDMLSQGWKFAGVLAASSYGGTFIFECVARPT